MSLQHAALQRHHAMSLNVTLQGRTWWAVTKRSLEMSSGAEEMMSGLRQSSMSTLSASSMIA